MAISLIVLQILMSVNPIPVRMEGLALMERDPTHAPAQNSIWARTVKVRNFVLSQQLKHFWPLRWWTFTYICLGEIEQFRIFCWFLDRDVDDCADNPCQNEGQCTDLRGDYSCNCTNSWTGKNCTCEFISHKCNGSLVSILIDEMTSYCLLNTMNSVPYST